MPINEPSAFNFSFIPPYPFFELGKRTQFQNLYNCRYINSLDWYSGNVDYSTIKDILHNYQNCTIIVKGLEKKIALQKYLPSSTSVVDLQQDFSLHTCFDFVHHCNTHTSLDKLCAINNVYKIRRVLEQKNLLH